MVDFHHPLRFVVATILVAVWTNNVAGEDAPDFDRIIALIRKAEEKYVSIEYKVEQREYLTDDVNTRKNFRPLHADANLSRRGWVKLEPQTGKFSIVQNYVGTWAEGTDPYAAGRTEYSFDGEQFREFGYSKPGAVMPDANDPKLIKRGTIDKEVRDLLYGLSKYGCGVESFPPYFRMEKLSDSLVKCRDKKPFSIKESPEHWEFIVLDPANEKLGMILEFRFDRKKGVVDRWQLTAPPEENPFMKAYFEHKEIKPGIWAPTRVEGVQIFSKRFSRIIYSDIRINEAIDPSQFRIKFPPGTFVRDKIEEMDYVIGKGAEDERTNIQEFSAKLKLQYTEERNPEVPKKPKTWLWWAGGGLFFVVLVFSWRYWLRSGRKSQAAIACFSLLFVQSTASAAELSADGDWIVRHSAVECDRISQCGLNVTFFALEYFQNAHSEARAVSRILPPNKDGIRLADIRDCLLGHGMQATARKKVSAEALERAIDGKTLAIVPLKLRTDSNHYVVLVRNADQELLMVDPPRGADPFDRDEMAKQLAHFDGLVLFVRKGNGLPFSDSVGVEPGETNLGTIVLTDGFASHPQTRKVQIVNRLSVPVLVTKVESSCGCIQPKWKGGLVPANATQEMEVVFLMNSWGPGFRTQSIRISYADGSKKEIEWSATGKVEKTVQKLAPSPEIVRVDLDAVGDGNLTIRREIGLLLADIPADAIRVVASKDWIRAKLLDGKGEKRTLAIELNLPKEVFFSGTHREELRLFSDPEQPPVKVPIAFHRTANFYVDPAPVVVKKSLKSPIAIGVLSRVSGFAIDCVVPVDLPVGITVVGEVGTEQPSLRITIAEAVAPGIYPVKCIARGGLTKRETDSHFLLAFELAVEP